MVSTIQTRQHGGHSHHHHGGGELLTSTNKKDAAVRIAWVGLYSNVLMVVAKGLGGFFLNSRTMISDALHAVTDLASDILTLAAVSFAARPPTANNPVGFGKVESMGSVVVSGLLFTGGAFMGIDAITSLWELWFPEAIAHAHAHAHSHDHGGSFGLLHHHHGASDLPNIHAAWIAIGSIAIKEWVYRKTMKVAEERKSSVLRSSAVHHRADSWTSMVSLVTIVSTHLLGGVKSIDPLGSLIVSTVVLRAGLQNLISAVKELGDRTVDDEVKKSVQKAANTAVSEACPSIGKNSEDVAIQKVQGIKSGPNNLVEVAINVPGSWTVNETMGLEQSVRDRIGAEVRGARRVKITFSPKEQELPAFAREYIDPNVHRH